MPTRQTIMPASQPLPPPAALRRAAAVNWRQRLSRHVSRDWSRPHWRVIYYHAVLPEQRTRFLEQLDALTEHFAWCSVSEGVEGLVQNTLDRPRLSLTFDDADQSVYDVVLPELSRYGVQACIYVVPQYVEHGHSFRDPRPRPIMTWQQLGEWIAAGHEVGSHTHTHANAALSTPERLRQEAEWSKAAIEDKLGVAVRHFAYPWGQYSPRSQETLRSLGCYDSIATTHRGGMTSGHNPLELYRDRVDLSRRPEDVETTMRFADRFYGIRHLAPGRLRAKLRRTTANRAWEALASRDELGISAHS